MALPKLNESPKYDLVIPSTQNKVRFRPYLVKEEKVLMMASESGDQRQALQAIIDTLKTCIADEVNVNEFTTFDVEYAFTQIRAKSVGEVSRIGMKCENCGESTEVDIPLDEIKIDAPKVEHDVQLTDSIRLKMKWPKYFDVLNHDLNNLNQTEQTFKLLIECIERVMTEEENILFADEPEQSRLDFIESLTSNQFAKIREFIEKMPKMKYNLKYKCQHCGTDHDINLEGMQDFL
jgi:rRNA maturation protein Nop10|tara:strand:+ start:4775 stop:5479 length:705 start_codon:yes stop_codon:yes gene_type:complete